MLPKTNMLSLSYINFLNPRLPRLFLSALFFSLIYASNSFWPHLQNLNLITLPPPPPPLDNFTLDFYLNDPPILYAIDYEGIAAAAAAAGCPDYKKYPN